MKLLVKNGYIPNDYHDINRFDESIFCQRFRELIRTSEKKQEEIQYEGGISQSTISIYLKDQKMPRAELIYKTARCFGVSADWLLGLSDIKSTDKAKRESCLYLGLSDDALDRIRLSVRLKEIVEWCAKVNGTYDFEKIYKIIEILKK